MSIEIMEQQPMREVRVETKVKRYFAIPSELAAILISESQAYGPLYKDNHEVLGATNFWIAVDDGKHVGFVWLFHQDTEHFGIGMHVCIAVAEGYRGNGLGSQLLETVETYLLRNGVAELQAIVLSLPQNGGRRVMKWLFDKGYKPVRDTTPSFVTKFTDAEYVEKRPNPMRFTKRLGLDLSPVG
jgi:ribosomal protein S18 acetylase RimI-like enzyme